MEEERQSSSSPVSSVGSTILWNSLLGLCPRPDCPLCPPIRPPTCVPTRLSGLAHDWAGLSRGPVSRRRDLI